MYPGPSFAVIAVAWWMTQPDAARTQTHLAPDDRKGWRTEDALRDLGPVLESVGHVYGDPPSFEIPWSHRNERCCRTVRNGKPRLHSPEILHHAGHDALAAVRNLKEWLK